MRKKSGSGRRTPRGVLVLALVAGLLWVPAAGAQTKKVPEGLVTAQAAAVVIGQKNFSDITSGADNQRWGAISGIAIAGSKLIVADSSYLAPPNNNRVLIYNDINVLQQRLPQDDLPAADVIVGQPGPNSTAAGTSATLMFQPSGVATDGTRLFVAEWGNNRILVFNQIPQNDGAAADVVIGQPDFTTNTVGTSSKSLRRPNNIATDGTRLYVADTLNNRALIYNSIPAQNGAAADVEIGQPTFDTFQRLPTAANTLYDPMSVTTDGQRLIVTDFGNNRVLIYNQIPTQNGASADVVVGQPDFISNSAGVKSDALNFPRYAFSDGTRLVIVDSGNNRILVYNQIPTSNGATADIVLGQEDFLGLLESCAASNFAVPFMATSDNGLLYVSDGFNRRILGFRPGPKMANAVVNGASFSTLPQVAACDVILVQPPIAPGGMASIFGANLADTTKQADSLPLPTEMGGVKVRFNGIPAPLYYVSPTQLNVQVPFEVTGYSASMEIERQTPNGPVVSGALPVGMANGAPGIFTWDGTGTGRGIITHADFTPVTDDSPAAPGETLVAFGTGLGTVDQPMTDGAAAQFASQGSVSIAGVSSAGQTVSIFLNGVPYSYTTVEGDLIADVVSRLAALITGNDPNISATADTGNGVVNLSARAVGDQGVSNVYSASVSEGGGLSANVGGFDQVPGTITFSGSPLAGQTITVFLLSTSFQYTTVAGDTLDSVINKVAALVDSDPNVSATADLPNHAIQLGLDDPAAALSITFSVSVSAPGASLTAIVSGATTGSSTAAVPGSIIIGGTPSAGQTVTVFLQGSRYSYTTTAGDTLESIVTSLANLINADANVSATADVPNLVINLALKTPNLSISFSTSVTLADALTVDTGGAGAAPATLTVSGSPKAGQIVTLFLSGTRYAYTVQDGDTAETIALKLGGLLNNDPNVVATVDGTTIMLALAGGAGALQVDTGGATAVPATLTISGSPKAGQIITVLLGSTRYTYSIVEGDTLASIATSLGALLDADANVSATADGATVALQLQTAGTSVSLSVTVSIPLAAVVTPPPGLQTVTSAQHFAPGIGHATNTVTATIGENLPVVPGTITLGGSPDPGQTITVTLADTTYSYTTVDGDTLQSVATNLAAVVNGDPNVSATADTANPTISLAMKDATSTVQIGFSVAVSPNAALYAISQSSTSLDSVAVAVLFAGPVKGSVGLDQVNFTVPSDAQTNPATKLSIQQNLIVFGSVTSFNIVSNKVTFPVVVP